jgi:predicted ester cyclase
MSMPGVRQIGRRRFAVNLRLSAVAGGLGPLRGLEPSCTPAQSLHPNGDNAAVTSEKNKGLIRRWIDFSNGGFVGSLDDFIAADYVGHLGAATMDRDELERLEREFCRAFPDAHHTVEDLIAEGDRVVLRTTARATHQADFEGITPTGRAVEFTGLERWPSQAMGRRSNPAAAGPARRVEPHGEVAAFLDLEGNRRDLLGPAPVE